MNVHVLPDPRALLDVECPASWPTLGPDDFAHHAPNATLIVRDADRVQARAALWWTGTPAFDGLPTGAIGYFAADSESATVALLDAACRLLREAGCVHAVGPMDGTTWRKYRLVTDAGNEPPFLMEPVNPAPWPTWFERAGFTSVAEYTSGVNSDLSVRDPRVPAAWSRLQDNGVTIRALRAGEFTDELRRIYQVAEVAFTANFLYTPVAFEQFAGQYERARQLVVPELVMIAEQGDRPVGFCFTIPDFLERQRGGAVKSVIIKTVAILPDRVTFGGLGSVMVDRTHAMAQELGFARAIHALMHDSNQSRRISERTGHQLRRYTLFGRSLSA